MGVGIYFDYDKDGPGKVIKNIKKGFDLLGIDYKLNSDSDINIILQDSTAPSRYIKLGNQTDIATV